VESAREDVGDGLREGFGAVELEELSGACGHEADIAADVDPSRATRIDTGDLREQAVAHLRNAPRTLLLEQLATMLGIFDALMLSPVSLVLCDDVRAVEHAHLAVARDERDRSARVARRYRLI